MLQFEVNGQQVEVADVGSTLLDVLREQLGLRSVKDGCSPQGQCGCCTVLVDGQARVACVTPARRVRGRSITTLEGLPPEDAAAWGSAFCSTGGSQCGFCTPGIVLRLESLHRKTAPSPDVPAPGASAAGDAAVEQALLAHLCRCTGWRTILDAWSARTAVPNCVPGAATGGQTHATSPGAEERAAIEGRTAQRVAPEVARGEGGFADDTAPDGALVAVPDGGGGWSIGPTLADARAASGKVQGRRTTSAGAPPIELPPGDWDVTLRTSWVEPAYLETDASWCEPGGEPASPVANGGAFGGKLASLAASAARQLADEHGQAVRVVFSREDSVRLGPKRPPVAGGMNADGTGILRVARTPGIAAAIKAVAPGLVVEEVDIPGPSTSADLRAAGWAEALALLTAATHPLSRPSTVPASPEPDAPAPDTDARSGVEAASGASGDARIEVVSPDGAVASAEVVLGTEPVVRVAVRCGTPLDETVLRSYCVGAAHMALSWVCSEGLVVDEHGEIHDLTIRSFGILRAVDTPPVEVTIEPADGPPVNGSDAVFAAVAAATWIAQGLPPAWPTGIRPRQ